MEDYQNSFICLDEEKMPYPRVCAHRGFSTVAPENTMPAYGAAIALGAEEIELDLWATTDGVIVSCHDAKLERISSGTGFVDEHSYAELLTLDFGSQEGGEKFAGLKIATFEDILSKFGRHTIMNVHVKARDDWNPLPDKTLISIIELIKKYGCEKYVYFMSGSPSILEALERLAPDIARCAGADERNGRPVYDLVDKALKYHCTKIQIYKPHFKCFGPDYLPDLIKRAHENGILCNMFYADDSDEAKKYVEMGCDTILTNNFLKVYNAVKG